MGCPDIENCTGAEAVECYPLPLMRDAKIIQQPAQLDQLASRYASFATDFITNASSSTSPFFLYLAFQHVHITNCALPDCQYASPPFYGSTLRGPFGDALAEMDWILGQVMDTLRHLGLGNETLVLFTSDNGPWVPKGLGSGSMGLLTGRYAWQQYGYVDTGKGSTWEGGVHVPALAWWPGTVPAASTCTALTSSLDVVPTALELAQVTAPPGTQLDGHSLMPLLKQPSQALSSYDYFYYFRDQLLFASRSASSGIKAHYYTKSGYGMDRAVNHTAQPLLFDVEQDPSEAYPLDNAVYTQELAALETASGAFLSTLIPGSNQLLGGNPKYGLCCDHATRCNCNEETHDEL